MKWLFLLFLLVGATPLWAIADLSFVVIDLKYRRDGGVKICEVQPASFSRFSGTDFLEGNGSLSQKYVKALEEYGLKGCFTHPLYREMKRAFVEGGWSSTQSVEEVAQKFPFPLLGDPDSLSDYTTAFFSLSSDPIFRGDPFRYPHILFLDRAILPYSESKYGMNYLLDQVEEMRQLRPIWRLYPKEATQQLVDQIGAEIPGEWVVLKPLQSTMGRGVVIVDKKELFPILTYLFTTPKELLIEDGERSYSHYAVDLSPFFLVEEFAPSDPLYLGEPPLPYDCTMRVACLLSYHQKEAKVTFLGEYWYSPSQPIDPAYSLIQSHKGKGRYYAKVDPETLREVRGQLTPALLAAYRLMLGESF